MFMLCEQTSDPHLHSQEAQICNYMQMGDVSKQSVGMNKNKRSTSSTIYFYRQSKRWSSTTIRLSSFEQARGMATLPKGAPAVINTKK